MAQAIPKGDKIVDHGDLTQTTCPGDAIIELIARGSFEPGNPPPGELPTPHPSSGYPVPKDILRRGSKGNDVRWVQYQLNRNGFNLTIDGSFGWITWRAVRM